jgi:hypothetical protein
MLEAKGVQPRQEVEDRASIEAERVTISTASPVASAAAIFSLSARLSSTSPMRG